MACESRINAHIYINLSHHVGLAPYNYGGDTMKNTFHDDVGMDFTPKTKVKPITVQDIITICKCKHYRTGYEGVGNYSRLQDLLRSKDLSEDQIKQCLHP